jgi:hypothetical protein
VYLLHSLNNLHNVFLDNSRDLSKSSNYFNNTTREDGLLTTFNTFLLGAYYVMNTIPHCSWCNLKEGDDV